MRQEIEEEAARLVVELAGATDAAAREQAIAWAAQSPVHAVAFARAEVAWESAARLRAAPPALADTDAEGDGSAERQARRFRFGRRAALGGLVAASIVGGLTIVQLQGIAGVDRYETGIGEHTQVTLADGSHVNLNTDSAIEVSIGTARRQVHLLRGEAMFDVAHEAHRPFLVRAGASSLQVLGTAFNVRIRDQMVELTVTRGAVGVRDGTAQLRRVPAGESAAIRGQTVAVAHSDRETIAQRTSWQDGMIALDGETLEQAVAEFNRYTPRPIVIGDPELAGLRVGGSFATGESRKFIQALQMTFPIRALSGPDQSILLVKASSRDAAG